MREIKKYKLLLIIYELVKKKKPSCGSIAREMFEWFF